MVSPGTDFGNIQDNIINKALGMTGLRQAPVISLKVSEGQIAINQAILEITEISNNCIKT